MADSASNAPMTTETRLPAGSTGKTFVAALALLLVEDGVLVVGPSDLGQPGRAGDELHPAIIDTGNLGINAQSRHVQDFFCVNLSGDLLRALRQRVRQGVSQLPH